MEIVVMLKQTPDTESVIRIADDGGSIVTDDVKWIINPYDEFAVEAALKLREKHGGKVTVLSWGPKRVADSIRTALAMGADSGLLINDPQLYEDDSLQTSIALAAAIRQISPDIVLCGCRAVDYDNAQRGARVAELLGYPHFSQAVSIDSDGTTVTVERPIEGGKVIMASELPVLITLGGSHPVWNPRYASLPGILKAKKKPLVEKQIVDLGLEISAFGVGAAKMRYTSFVAPPARKPGRMLYGADGTAAAAKELARVLREELKLI